jgi:hypothetical protein
MALKGAVEKKNDRENSPLARRIDEQKQGKEGGNVFVFLGYIELPEVEAQMANP